MVPALPKHAHAWHKEAIHRFGHDMRVGSMWEKRRVRGTHINRITRIMAVPDWRPLQPPGWYDMGLTRWSRRWPYPLT